MNSKNWPIQIWQFGNLNSKFEFKIWK
jgi:hypothetical protein